MCRAWQPPRAFAALSISSGSRAPTACRPRMPPEEARTTSCSPRSANRADSPLSAASRKARAPSSCGTTRPSNSTASTTSADGRPGHRPGTRRPRTRARPGGLAAPDAQHGHLPDGLEHDRLRHLRSAEDPVGERDRDLDHAKAAAQRPVGRLDLEGVAARVDRVELDRLEHGAPVALEAAREVADAYAEQDQIG